QGALDLSREGEITRSEIECDRPEKEPTRALDQQRGQSDGVLRTNSPGGYGLRFGLSPASAARADDSLYQGQDSQRDQEYRQRECPRAQTIPQKLDLIHIWAQVACGALRGHRHYFGSADGKNAVFAGGAEPSCTGASRERSD